MKELGAVGIGGSIFLIAAGAILAWAVHIQAGWLDLRVVGYVLMVAGLFGLILTLWFWSNRRRAVSTRVSSVSTPPGVPVERQRVVREDRVVAPEDYPVPPDQGY